MPFIESTDKYQKWNYEIAEFFILYPDGTKTDIPTNRINSINIMHSYKSNLFPIFKIELVLSGYTYFKILKNKKDIKFKIRIQKYYTEIDSDKKSLYRDWINDTYDLILDDDDYDSDESLYKESKKYDYTNISNKETENDMFEVDNVIEFFLFKSELVNKFNFAVNAILTDATINDGIQYIATKIGLDNLLMSNPHNITTYKEMIIPPLKAKQAIKFLDTYYGIYKTGMLFYVDMIANISYLLEYSSKCTAYQANEIKETDILIPMKTNKQSSELCSLYRRGNTEKYFIIGSNTNINIRNETISLNEYASTDAKIIDTYTGTVKNSNSNVLVKDTKTVNILENNTENEWFTDIYSSLINSKNAVIDVALSNYDIDAIAPNKLFKLVFEDTTLALKHKKGLVVSDVSHSLLKEGNQFMLTSIVTLQEV